MSFIRFQQMCNSCGKDWEASFGIVGRTQIGSRAEVCPHCGSKDIQSVPAQPLNPPVKPRYSFVGKKHKLEIDGDIWQHTAQYVKDQIAIMTRHGSAPDPPLSEDEWNDLVYTIADYPQTIRNLQKAKNNEVGGTGAIPKTA